MTGYCPHSMALCARYVRTYVQTYLHAWWQRTRTMRRPYTMPVWLRTTSMKRRFRFSARGARFRLELQKRSRDRHSAPTPTARQPNDTRACGAPLPWAGDRHAIDLGLDALRLKTYAPDTWYLEYGITRLVYSMILPQRRAPRRLELVAISSCLIASSVVAQGGRSWNVRRGHPA